jgi:NAD+ kinase
MSMKHFAIFVNPAYAEKDRLFFLLESLSTEFGIHFYGLTEQADILPKDYPLLESAGIHGNRPDCILVFGGDGTILRARDTALRTNAPILGINLGYLGFLSETTLSGFRAALNDLVTGKYTLLNRMLLSCQLRRKGETIYKGLALNDAVIYRADTPRLINVRIYNGGRFIFDTRCDGVITSTPTGSTAYSLSAGGPLLSPQMQAIVLNPLNPHLLTVRPMVFPASDKIILKVHNLTVPASLQLDGVTCAHISENDEVFITASKHAVKFIKLSNRTFYQILRRKMHLGK